MILLVFFALISICLADVNQYNVEWQYLQKEPSDTYLNTMPLGNGDLTLLAWADNSTGSVTVLLSKTDAWNEAGELIKIGYVTLSFDPNPFQNGPRFRQYLNLSTATMTFEIGGVNTTTSPPTITTTMYIDINQNTVVIDSSASSAFFLTVTTTVVRPGKTQFTPFEDCTSYTIYPDVYVTNTSTITSNPVLALYHRNNPVTYYTNQLNSLNLGSLLPSYPDPLLNRTVGAVVWGTPNLAVKNASILVSNGSATHFQVGVSVVTAQTTSEGAYLTLLGQLYSKGIPDKSAHLQWWQQFWARSYIEVRSDFQVSSQYALWRFVEAIQTRTPFALKFNGMLFTANRPPNEDYRDWGGHNWWQNARLPYYNLLPAGDQDLLVTFFQLFLNQLNFAKAKTTYYYNYTGAFWDEYNSFWGTTLPGSYGCGRQGSTNPPQWYSEDQWNHYNLQGGLDLSLMILDHWAYTQNATVLTTFLPIVTNVIDFYTQYHKNTDSSGKLHLYPTQSIETWQCPNYPPSSSDCVTNDMPTIAGFYAVLPRLLALPTQYTTSQQRDQWSAYLAKLPPLPMKGSGSTQALAACDICSPSPTNVENPELYAVHPYRLYTAAVLGPDSAALQPALTAFAERVNTEDDGWCQNAMDAALLGLGSQAQQMVVNRAALAPAPGYRFNVFMPHLQDYEPSADHLSVFNNALQYMLMQTMDDADQNIFLFPSWPCAWDVDFKIHGPMNTVIEGSMVGGQASFTVTPSAREGNVKVQKCFTTAEPIVPEVGKERGGNPAWYRKRGKLPREGN